MKRFTVFTLVMISVVWFVGCSNQGVNQPDFSQLTPSNDQGQFNLPNQPLEFGYAFKAEFSPVNPDLVINEVDDYGEVRFDFDEYVTKMEFDITVKNSGEFRDVYLYFEDEHQELVPVARLYPVAGIYEPNSGNAGGKSWKGVIREDNLIGHLYGQGMEVLLDLMGSEATCVVVHTDETSPGDLCGDIYSYTKKSNENSQALKNSIKAPIESEYLYTAAFDPVNPDLVIHEVDEYGEAQFQFDEYITKVDFDVSVKNIGEIRDAYLCLEDAHQALVPAAKLYPVSGIFEPNPGNPSGKSWKGVIREENLFGQLQGQGLEVLLDLMGSGETWVVVHTDGTSPGDLCGEIVSN